MVVEAIVAAVDAQYVEELEEFAPLCVVLDFWVDELGLIYPLAVEGDVPRGNAYFGLAEDDREETVLVTPFVVTKWIAKSAICSTRCYTKLRVGCTTIELSGKASTPPLTI